MRGRTRLVLAGTAALVAVAALAALLTLRAGRPLYYSDGRSLVRADALADRPMAVLDRPVPVGELPGPVRGRVAALADGRLVYGRARGEERTELVVFDPSRPDREPLPLLAEPHDGHDLSPALDAEGGLWFASDRDGGEGGFDLFVAPGLGRGRFGLPVPLPAPLNGPGDELDPAPAPDGTDLVFVRPADDGQGARLWQAPRDGSRAPAPVFAERIDPRSRLLPRIDREPAFAPDGLLLWFVREVRGERVSVMSSVRHAAEFAAPVPEPAFAGRRLRSPSPAADGCAVLGEGPAPLWSWSAQRLVQPWWAGQQALERALWITFLLAVLLLAMLLLGARWRALDLVTWCLLLSLLLHLLLWFLLEGLPLPARELPEVPDSARLTVRMVAAAQDGERGSGRSDLAARAVRPERALDVAVAAPASALPAQQGPASPSAEAGVRPDEALDPVAVAAPATVPLDAAAAPERAAADEALEPAIPNLAALAAAPAPVTARAARPATAADAIEVAAPESGAAAPGSAPPRLRAAAERPAALALRTAGATRAPAPARASLADAVEPIAPRSTVEAAVAMVASAPLAELPGNATAPEFRALTQEPARAGIDAAAPPSALPGLGVAAARPRPNLAGPATAIPEPATRASQRPELLDPVALTAAVRGTTDPVTDPALESFAANAVSTPAPQPATLVAPGRPAVPAPDPIRAGPDLRAGSALPAAGIRSSLPVLPRLAGSAPLPVARPAPPTAQAALADAIQNSTGPAAGSASEASTAALAALGPLAAAEPRTPAPARPSRPSPALPFAAAAPTTALPQPALRLAQVPAPPRRSDPTSLYGNRFGPQKAEALERFGGSAETEAAVRRGLAYLASIQDEAGHWGRRSFEHSKYGETWVGKTGLCLLAFLGAGHLPGGTTEHAGVSARAVEALLRTQHRDSGHFGVTSAYSHGIATYALAECYALTKDARLRGPLERAVAWIVTNQDRSRDPRSRGGWGYFSPFLRAEDGYARTSVSSWQIMALESARRSGIAVEAEVLDGARAFLRQMFDPRRGSFLYSQEPSRLRSRWRTLPASTPAATFCLLLLGEGRDDPRVLAGLEYTQQRRPAAWKKASDDAFVLRGEGNPYFWYYGSLAAFLAGGETWTGWNEALKSCFLPAQNADGSFTPIGAYAEYADERSDDRSYTTALAVLSLEVYYRYFTPLLGGG